MIDIRLRTSALLAFAVISCAPPERDVPDGVAALPAATMDSLLASAADAGGGSAPTVAATPADSGVGSATLAEIGYRDGITFTGAVDATTISIPVNRGRSPAELTLQLSPTPRMPDATIVMRQGGRILAQRLITDSTTQVALPLSDALVADGRAVVTLGMHVPGRDVCEAPLFYRTAVAPYSSVRYIGADRAVTSVSSFFPPLLRKVTFYLPDDPSLDAAQAALDAAAFVARNYRGAATTYVIAPMPADSAAIPEPSWDERALVWTGDGITRVIMPEGGRGTVLAIASRRDARQLFTLAQGPSMVPTSGFAATTVRLDDGAARLVSLDELGHGNRTITGSVYASSGYRIALADFGGSDVPRAFRLLARHSALPVEGVGEVAFLVNDAIVWSRRVDGTVIDATIAIPERLVARENTFEVRFTLRLGEGECRLGTPLFTATIDGESAFVVGGRSPLPPSFDRFPTALLPTFSVQLEPRDRYRVELAAGTIFAMQQTTSTPLAPFLVRDAAEVRGALLAVGTTATAEALQAPVSTDGFRLRDIDGRVWDEYRPTEAFGAMQAFERGGRNILLLHHTGSDGQPLADLLRESLDPYGWFGVHGDLALRGPEGPTTTIKAGNAGWRIESLAPGTQSALARWRSAIFLGAAILLLGLLIWLYPRVVRRELDPAG